MLAVIEYGRGLFYVAEVSDCSYEAVSKAFETIGHPELKMKNIKTLKADTDYFVYDWDDIATKMVEQNKKDITEVDLETVEPAGVIWIPSEKFVFIEQC